MSLHDLRTIDHWIEYRKHLLAFLDADYRHGLLSRYIDGAVENLKEMRENNKESEFLVNINIADYLECYKRIDHKRPRVTKRKQSQWLP